MGRFQGQGPLVEITLSERLDNGILGTITEGTMDMDEGGLAWYGGNTAGWANSLACLKAYVEYGINLRKAPSILWPNRHLNYD